MKKPDIDGQKIRAMIQLSTSWEPAFIVARIKNLWKKTKKLRQKPQKTLSFVLFCQSLNAYYSFSTDDLALGELSTRGISIGGSSTCGT